jgi:hypothetical protein
MIIIIELFIFNMLTQRTQEQITSSQINREGKQYRHVRENILETAEYSASRKILVLAQGL